MGHNVSVFKPYPFAVGQKIRIEDTRRAGDWEIAKISEHTVTFRCPISGKEFEWNTFCYLAEEETDSRWPQET